MDVRERLVDARVLAVVPQRLVLVQLDHTAMAVRLMVPILRIVRIHWRTGKR